MASPVQKFLLFLAVLFRSPRVDSHSAWGDAYLVYDECYCATVYTALILRPKQHLSFTTLPLPHPGADLTLHLPG